VKQDTVKTSNQISDTRWGALSGLRLEQPVICAKMMLDGVHMTAE
jgi:hypothetical protein